MLLIYLFMLTNSCNYCVT